MAKSRRKSPSRVRYEESHPTVSCRVPKEVYDRLWAVKEAEGLSFTDILKVGLGLLEACEEKEADILKKGHALGYRKGHAEAKSLYQVTYPCKVCGGTLTVTTREEKEAVRQYMREHGWGHSQCIERQR